MPLQRTSTTTGTDAGWWWGELKVCMIWSKICIKEVNTFDGETDATEDSVSCVGVTAMHLYTHTMRSP